MRQIYEEFKQIVKDIGGELGIAVKALDVLGSTDQDTKQIALLIVETCDDMLCRFPWRRTIGTNPWVAYSDGSFGYKLTADDNVILIDSRVLKLGAKWRYLNTKGLKYGEVFQSCQIRIQAFSFDQNKDNVVNDNAGDTVTTI